MHVLIVEDDQDAHDYLVMLAAMVLSGHRVAAAFDGLAALRLARTVRPDLILLDLMMPVVGGRLFRQYQLADPALAVIPTILLTPLPEAAALSVDLGVPVLRKPLDSRGLVAAVDAVVTYASASSRAASSSSCSPSRSPSLSSSGRSSTSGSYDSRPAMSSGGVRGSDSGSGSSSMGRLLMRDRRAAAQ
jgi:DNA-binding response OmpR family regulator